MYRNMFPFASDLLHVNVSCDDVYTVRMCIRRYIGCIHFEDLRYVAAWMQL